MSDIELTPEIIKAAAKAFATSGAVARAKKLSARRRSEIAKIAANARWGKRSKVKRS